MKRIGEKINWKKVEWWRNDWVLLLWVGAKSLEFFRNFCEGAHSKVVLSPFVFQGLFCCVIAEFAPNVTDTSHPDYFTHDAVVFYSLFCSCFKEQCIYCITLLYFKRIYLHCAVLKHYLVLGIPQLFLFFLLFSYLQSSRQEDRSHSLDCGCSNKEETGRACPPLISLAQTLVVNGKC